MVVEHHKLTLGDIQTAVDFSLLIVSAAFQTFTPTWYAKTAKLVAPKDENGQEFDHSQLPLRVLVQRYI